MYVDYDYKINHPTVNTKTNGENFHLILTFKISKRRSTRNEKFNFWSQG